MKKKNRITRERTKQFNMRLSEAEHMRLFEHASKCGYKASHYVRSLIKGSQPAEMPPLEYHALMKELRGIGNRINQIAIRAHTTGFVMAEEYEKHYDEYRRFMLRIQETFLPTKFNPTERKEL